jgi:hypothetical protein
MFLFCEVWEVYALETIVSRQVNLLRLPTLISSVEFIALMQRSQKNLKLLFAFSAD